MSIFDTLVIISFLFIVFLFFLSNFLYQRLNICLEGIKDLRSFNEKSFELIKDLEKEVSQYRYITESTQENQNNLKEKFKELQRSFLALKETATELQSAHKTKKAVLDLMKR